MAWYLSRVIRPGLGQGDEVLEIGPGKIAIQFFFRSDVIEPARYTLADNRRRRARARRFLIADARALPFADASFDAILCNNVLPYVDDDMAALGELRRCLRDDGIAMINAARRPGVTRSVAEFRRLRPDLEDSHFVNHGDRWVYGDDLFARYVAAGLHVRVDRPFRDCNKGFIHRNGLRANAEFVVAFRDRAGEARFPRPRPPLVATHR